MKYASLISAALIGFFHYPLRPVDGAKCGAPKNSWVKDCDNMIKIIPDPVRM